MSPIFNDDDQLALVTHLQKMACDFYDTDYQPRTDVTQSLDFQNLTAVSRIPYIDEDLTSDVREWLLSKNVTGFAHYKRSYNSGVLVGITSIDRKVIIRIPTPDGNADEHQRVQHPAALQPFPGATFPYDDGNIEILPFVKVIGFVSTPTEENRFRMSGDAMLRAMYHMAGLTLWMIKEDLGVLPDGTPLPVDPDILTLRREKQLSLEETIIRQSEIIQEFPLMAPLAWIKDGKPAQDKFFGADYLTGKPAAKLDVTEVGVKPRAGVAGMGL